jgi:hypothetical protein
MLKVLRINKQSLMALAWVYKDLQTNWVWPIANPRGGGSASLPDSCPLDLNTWLSQGCWVWQLVESMFVWTQHMADPKGVGYGRSSYSYPLELSTLTQRCRVWQLIRPMFTWTRHMTEPNSVGSSSSLDPYPLGLDMWLIQWYLM